MTGFGALSWKIPTTVASFDQSDVEQCKLFAKQQFELSEIQKDGTSLKDQLLNVERQTGIKPKELQDLVELPEVFSSCWSWFLDLNSARTSGAMAPNPITFTEMKCYFDLMEIQPEPWEVHIIKMLDGIALGISEKKLKQSQDTKTRKTK